MKLLPVKLRIYETLYHLNRAFELVSINLERLDKLGVMADRRSLREYRALSEELRADVNHRLMETLEDREEKDWARFGRLARQREKRLRDPKRKLPQKLQPTTPPRKQTRA